MGLVLHIGLPKTGSSFLQAWLGRNRAVLARRGINAVSLMASHRIAVECLTGVLDDDRPDVRQIRSATSLQAALAEARTNAHSTLISSEYLHHCAPARLDAFLTEAGLRVSGVLCYLRRQDHLFASAYAQEVKALGVGRPIASPGYTEALNWNVLHESWTAGFTNAEVRFRAYEKCRSEGSLLRSFTAALGATGVATMDDAPFRNLSLSAEMTEVARVLNQRGQVFDPGVLLDIQMAAPMVPFGLSPELTHAFETLFLDSNEALAQRSPAEFAAYAAPGWTPAGEDLTHRLTDARIRQVLVEYDRLSGSNLAGMLDPPHRTNDSNEAWSGDADPQPGSAASPELACAAARLDVIVAKTIRERTTMTISAQAQRILVWWSLAFVSLYGFAIVVLLHMVPPPPATWGVDQVAAFYLAHAGSMRLGAALAAWTSGFMVPLAVVIAVQMWRLEKGVPIWAITELVGGIMMSIFLVLPPDFWGAGAFHPDRLADATEALNDLANVTLVTTDQYYMFQLVPIIMIALTRTAVAHSPFPRWFGFYTIWTGLMFEVGPLGFLFKTGPFAWDGLIVFWLPLSLFGLWIGVTAYLLLRAIKLQETSDGVRGLA